VKILVSNPDSFDFAYASEKVPDPIAYAIFPVYELVLNKVCNVDTCY